MTEHLYWVGNISLVLQVVVITLVLTRHRVAPLAAVSAGFPLAIGVAGVAIVRRDGLASFIDAGTRSVR